MTNNVEYIKSANTSTMFVFPASFFAFCVLRVSANKPQEEDLWNPNTDYPHCSSSHVLFHPVAHPPHKPCHPAHCRPPHVPFHPVAHPPHYGYQSGIMHLTTQYYYGQINITWHTTHAYSWGLVNVVLTEVDYHGRVIPGTIIELGKVDARIGHADFTKYLSAYKHYGIYVGVVGDPATFEKMHLGFTDKQGSLAPLFWNGCLSHPRPYYGHPTLYHTRPTHVVVISDKKDTDPEIELY